MEAITWVGIVFCISQSAMFSGLNLAFFSLTKLRLEVEKSKGNPRAIPVAKLREDSNFLLATILWGNVSVNVLLTLLSGSVLAGAAAFFFSTFVITIVGEIIPQAYLSRNALRAAALLSPAIRAYQVFLYPLAKPTALVLNKWLGREAIQYVPEEDLTALIEVQRGKATETGIGDLASQGLINFMRLDEIALSGVGSAVDPATILRFDDQSGSLSLPERGSEALDRVLESARRSKCKWLVLTDKDDVPRRVLDTEALLSELQKGNEVELADCCYDPLVYSSPERSVGDVLEAMHERAHKVVLLWEEDARRIITNRDLLRLLVDGIVDARP